jgi:hypothetical protein
MDWQQNSKSGCTASTRSRNHVGSPSWNQLGGNSSLHRHEALEKRGWARMGSRQESRMERAGCSGLEETLEGYDMIVLT